MTLASSRSRRHTRQIRLADVGEPGQAKLYATRVELGGEGFARTIEDAYVRAAGMGVFEAAVEGHEDGASKLVSPVPAVSELGLRHAPAREVADGALRALSAIRAALGITS